MNQPSNAHGPLPAVRAPLGFAVLDVARAPIVSASREGAAHAQPDRRSLCARSTRTTSSSRRLPTALTS
jgi:hypothetical protein